MRFKACFFFTFLFLITNAFSSQKEVDKVILCSKKNSKKKVNEDCYDFVNKDFLIFLKLDKQNNANVELFSKSKKQQLDSIKKIGVEGFYKFQSKTGSNKTNVLFSDLDKDDESEIIISSQNEKNLFELTVLKIENGKLKTMSMTKKAQSYFEKNHWGGRSLLLDFNTTIDIETRGSEKTIIIGDKKYPLFKTEFTVNSKGLLDVTAVVQ